MERYLQVLNSVVPDLSKEDLYAPIPKTSIDSLDLVQIRVVLRETI